jgi:biotin carboxylase
MKDLGLRTPSFLTVNSEIELKSRIDQLLFPLIVKPVDLTGGNGITKISNPSQASRAFDFAFGLSPGKTVIVEEFLEGTYHGFSTIIVDKKVVFSFFDDEFYLFDPYRVSATSSPSLLEESDKFDVIQQIETFASAFNLVDGILHVQLISTAKGVYILEICRRTPGDLYPYFVEYATGFDYPKAIFQGFLGETIDIQKTNNLSEDCKFVRFILMPRKRGVFRKITKDESFERFMIGKVPLISPGTSIEHPRVTPLQIYFFKIDSNVSCKDFLMNLQNNIEVQIDNFE